MQNKNVKKPSYMSRTDNNKKVNKKKNTIKAKKNSSVFSFKRYKKTEGGQIKKGKHPKLIVDEVLDEYGFMGLTESPKRGNHKNIELSKNPQKGKISKSYIRDELRYDNKKNFGEILSDYNLTDEDKIKILKYLERHKKKK